MEEVKFGKNADRFYIGESEEKPLAEVTFRKSKDNALVLDHTYVSKALRGKGLGRILVDKVVEYARANKKKIMPTCPFAKDVLEGDGRYADVLLVGTDARGKANTECRL